MAFKISSLKVDEIVETSDVFFMTMHDLHSKHFFDDNDLKILANIFSGINFSSSAK